MNIVRIGRHNFRVLSSVEREIRGGADCSQSEYCLKCGMRLDYYNKNMGVNPVGYMCKVEDKEVEA